MLLFLMGASTGAAYAVANPGVTDVKITQPVSYTHLDVYKRQSIYSLNTGLFVGVVDT